MAPEVRRDIVEILENSRQELNAAAGGVAEGHARTHPQEGRWSILDCVEHVTAVEERFLSRLEEAHQLDSPHIDRQKEAELLVRVASRTNRGQAPEYSHPVGRFASLAQALEQFNATRSKTVQFAESRAAELYSLSAEHPRFGVLNGTEWLMLIAAHGRRHADQIREVRAAVAKA